MGFDLAAQIARAGSVGATVRLGSITAVATRTVSVAYGGGAVAGVARLAAYAPVVGDVVVVLSATGYTVVLGKLA